VRTFIRDFSRESLTIAYVRSGVRANQFIVPAFSGYYVV
jgi:hypothetical protein